MADKPKTTEKVTTKSGVLPRPILEPEARKEPPRPTTLPQYRDEGATTGAMPTVTEGEDPSAERDEDRGNQ